MIFIGCDFSSVVYVLTVLLFQVGERNCRRE